MEIKVCGWESRSLRCPDLKVELITSEDSNTVSIIQMPNGTGKTSTLELLRAALSGEARNWSSAKIFEFRALDGSEDGYFRVDLLVDSRALVFELSLDFDSGKARYSTTSPMIGGRRSGWEPPSEVRRFLHKDFVDLIVFDGEFASGVLDSTSSNAERAVDAMSQLYLFDKAKSLAEEERERIVSSAGVSANPQTLKNKSEKLVKVVQKIEKAKSTRDSLTKKLKQDSENLERIDRDFDTALKRSSGDAEQIDNAKEKIAQAAAAREACVKSLMESLRVPSSICSDFTEALGKFQLGMEAVKLPPSTTRQFFRELANQPICVCGRPIDEHIQQVILEQSEQYLGQEEAGVLNAIKAQIDDRSNDQIIPLASLTENLKKAVNQHHEFKTDLNEIELSLTAPSTDLDALRRERDELAEAVNKSERVLTELERPASLTENPDSMCIAALEKQRKLIEKDIEVLTDTVDVGERTRTVVELIDGAKRLARERVREQLRDLANERLGKILRQSPVEIEQIDSFVKLKNQSDASVGQKLAVGYVIMANLLQRGAHSFPFIVDSPANPIDHTVRREVARLIPTVCDQFITFVISSEKKAFTSVLGETADKSQFLTIFRKLDGTDGHLTNGQKGVSESARFVMVEGREFFDSFDMDEEA